MSYLGRINYTLKSRYLFTASFRADGSSKFPKGNKFSYFPSGAFAWKMNEEAFLKNVKEIDQLKLRLSYGRTGNQSINTLAALAMMSKNTIVLIRLKVLPVHQLSTWALFLEL